MKTIDGITERLNFILAACEATKEDGEAEFICPICGGRARATKSSYDKHIHAFCEKCRMKLMQ